MSARAALHSFIETDQTLMSIGVQAVYTSNAVDSPTEDLFVIVKWEPTAVAFKSTGAGRVSIWVHDRQRDYGRIDRVLDRLKNELPTITHRAGADGWILTLVEWLGEGPDLFDGGYGTVTRYADFTVLSRYNPL